MHSLFELDLEHLTPSALVTALTFIETIQPGRVATSWYICDVTDTMNSEGQMWHYLNYLFLLLDPKAFLMLKACLKHAWPFIYILVLWRASSWCHFPDILACGKILSPGAFTVSKAFVSEPPSFLSNVTDLYFHSLWSYYILLHGDLCPSWHLVTQAQENKDLALVL